MISASIDTAPSDISATGWRMVVSSGQIVVASGVSSKPQTERSRGHVETLAMRRRDRRRGHVVIAGEDRGRHRFEREQVLGRLQPGTIGEVAGGDQLLVERDPRFLEGGAIALLAKAAGGMIGPAGDEADAAMAEADQMAGHFERGAEIVDADRGERRGRTGRAGRDDRDAGAEQPADEDFGVAERRRQDHAVDARIDQRIRGRRLVGVEPVALDDQLGVDPAAAFEGADQEFGEIGGARDPREQADADDGRAGEAFARRDWGHNRAREWRHRRPAASPGERRSRR